MSCKKIACENCDNLINEYDIYHIHIDTADEHKFEFQWCEKCFRAFNIGVQLGKGYERQAMRNLLDEREEHEKKDIL